MGSFAGVFAEQLTRRRFLVSSAGVLAALASSRAARAEPTASSFADTVQRFHSRPDLTPPAMVVGTRAPAASDGYVLVAPFVGQANGTALIADDAGEPVWIYQSSKLVMNFRTQTLDGSPVLTWWEGTVENGLFTGECVIADESYRIIERLSAGNGFQPEVHEFLITAQNTVLMSVNNLVAADLSAYGGPSEGTIVEGVLQEIDLASGEVLLEWHSLDHVGLDETQMPVSPTWDYFHLNSIDVAADDNLLVSARYPSTVYKLDRRSGEVIWRLGGSKSDFQLGPAAAFWFQHDARSHPSGRLSLFDDGSDGITPAPETVSRAIVLALDETARTATLVSAFPNPRGSLTSAMGNCQLLHTGGCFVGWGTVPQISEFASDGTLLFDATFPAGDASYRAFRSQWQGRAPGKPDVAAAGNADGSLDVYASWNGATRVSHWRVLGGAGPDALQPLLAAPRTGFETRLRLAQRPAHVAAEALDAAGRSLGRSVTIAT